jgi:hypothetical protein
MILCGASDSSRVLHLELCKSLNNITAACKVVLYRDLCIGYACFSYADICRCLYILTYLRTGSDGGFTCSCCGAKLDGVERSYEHRKHCRAVMLVTMRADDVASQQMNVNVVAPSEVMALLHPSDNREAAAIGAIEELSKIVTQ